jgi:hypothetical protein
MEVLCIQKIKLSHWMLANKQFPVLKPNIHSQGLLFVVVIVVIPLFFGPCLCTLRSERTYSQLRSSSASLHFTHFHDV